MSQWNLAQKMGVKQAMRYARAVGVTLALSLEAGGGPVRTSTIWVCGDCLFAREGYGVQEPDREPWSLLPNADVELGSFHEPSCQEGGSERCDAHNVVEADSSPCDACGSEMEGTRYAYTLFEALAMGDHRAAG